MADQRAKAGNIGDVIKHTLLAEMVYSFGIAQETDWIYCETHAGFYEYDLALLKNGDKWKGERAWSAGVVERSGQMPTLGKYGVELGESLKNNVYPGSIRIVNNTTTEMSTLKCIFGWDNGEDRQVASFVGKSDRICVSSGDGYGGVKSLQADSKLIFCDPFWDDPVEMDKVVELLTGEPSVIVWYPLSAGTKQFRDWAQERNLIVLEACYRNYRGGKGWGRDMQGAGLVVQGLPDSSIHSGLCVGRSLKAIFEGQRHPGTPSKKKDGSITIPPDRELSLRLTLSF